MKPFYIDEQGPLYSRQQIAPLIAQLKICLLELWHHEHPTCDYADFEERYSEAYDALALFNEE